MLNKIAELSKLFLKEDLADKITSLFDNMTETLKKVDDIKSDKKYVSSVTINNKTTESQFDVNDLKNQVEDLREKLLKFKSSIK